MLPPPGGPTDGSGDVPSSPGAAPGPIDGISLSVGSASDGAGAGESEGMTGVALAALTQLGIGAWAVPGMVMGVPGLLVVLVVLLQAAGAGAWLPVARRALSGTGVDRKRPRVAEDERPSTTRA
jgi:hypothetical protein